MEPDYINYIYIMGLHVTRVMRIINDGIYIVILSPMISYAPSQLSPIFPLHSHHPHVELFHACRPFFFKYSGIALRKGDPVSLNPEFLLRDLVPTSVLRISGITRLD